MMAKYGSGGLQLASDKEKLRLLRAERDRDIAALLSPAELADYELRTSPSAATLRSRYGDGIESEEEFKKLYALQKAFDDQFPADALNGRVTPEAMRARADAQRQLQDDMRAAVGDDKYAALRRASDYELRALDSLVGRLNLPADTTDRVVAARESYATASQRINAESAHTFPEKRAQLQDLGNRAKADLTSTLGSEAAEAYAPRASWIGMLQNGLAFSTTPTANSPGSLSLGGGTQSVFPVMPTGAPGGTNGRTVINYTSTTSDSSGGSSGGGAVFFGGVSGDPTTPRTMQVISTTTTISSGHGDATSTVTPTPAAPKP